MLNNSSDHCLKCAVKDFCLPAGLQLNKLHKLDKLAKEKAIFHKGDLLFETGSSFSHLFVVQSGSFKTYLLDKEGNQQITSFNLPGAILGFDALNDERHSLTTQALETASVCEISFKNLFELASDTPSLQRRLLNLASQRHDCLCVINPNQSALKKVCSLLLDFSLRFKSRGLSATDFYLSMSRQDIANYLGLTNETTSRIFSQLVKDNVFQLRTRHITGLNIDQLNQILLTN